MLRIARNFLETTKKTSKFQAILPDQFGVILMGMKQKIETAYSKKWKFSKSPILKFFSRKFHRLVLGLVGLIDEKGIDVVPPIWS